ncbi:hypothetical protein EP331_08060 [bacterium]|nr:MAG: hypothetical protein EP331_08060 [bacterium]
MKNSILQHLNNPSELEKLFRDNKSDFKQAFNVLYPEIKENLTAQIWHERLNYEQSEINWGSKSELYFILITAFLAGLLAKFPAIFALSEDFFYQRNIGFIVFPALSAFFLWKNNARPKKWLGVFGVFLIASVYINGLPNGESTQTYILACIHLPLFLWTVWGFSFSGNAFNDFSKRLAFLQFNGDFIVMTTIIMISGGIMTAITINLFLLIQINIIDVYMHTVGTWGLAAVPIAASFLVRTNPQLVNKVSPIIAKVFTPLVLVMVSVYLGAVLFAGKDPFNDRDFLILFNVLLIGVMALILFSVAESTKNGSNTWSVIVLFALSIVTILVNGIALSAIIFRISEWGITPNRLAVFGSNVLILVNLLIVSYRLFASTKNKEKLNSVADSIAFFLPIYSIWTFFVTFFFPLLFGFK